MGYYNLGTMNEQPEYGLFSSPFPIPNDQTISPSPITRDATTTILQAHAIGGYQDEFIKDGLPSSSSPSLQNSFSDIEENMASWGSGIISAGSGNVGTEVALFTPAFLDQPTGPSTSDFVDPQALFSQEDLQETTNFRPAMHQQQSGLALSTRAQAHQQAEQEVAEKQQVQPQHNYVSSSPAPLTPCPPSNSHYEEIISGIVNQIHKNSQFACQDDTPAEPAILPRVVKRRRAKDNMDEGKRSLASEAGKKLSSEEPEYVAQLEDKVVLETNENKELRVQNRALIEENARFRTFIKTLFRHPAFTPFLEDLSRDGIINSPIFLTSPVVLTE
ncbi:hypothetical protein DL768_010730 [Monosporascus sp. mg162]|nr:hypothetical protein DL768_010730 [Monosporascus sp. mg162]